MSFWLRQSWIFQHCNLKNWIRLFLGSRVSRVFRVKRTSQKGGSSIRLQNKSQDSADPPHGHTLKRAMIASLHLLWWHLCLSQQLTPNPSSVNTAVTSAYLFVQSFKGYTWTFGFNFPLLVQPLLWTAQRSPFKINFPSQSLNNRGLYFNDTGFSPFIKVPLLGWQMSWFSQVIALYEMWVAGLVRFLNYRWLHHWW